MWRDIAITNKKNIADALLKLEQRLAHIRENLDSRELADGIRARAQTPQEFASESDFTTGAQRDEGKLNVHGRLAMARVRDVQDLTALCLM